MSEKKRAAALMDEYPILVYPSLALALGVNRAIVFQQLHFLLNGQKTAKNMYNYIDDKWWVYNSYQEWKDQYFTWLAPVTLKGIFNSLEADGLIVSMQSVKNPSDRRKWYTINYEAWDKFYLTIGQKVSDQPTDKKYPMVGQKVSDGYSETSSEDTTENKDTPLPPKRGKREKIVNPDILKENETIVKTIKGYIEGLSIVPVTNQYGNTSNRRAAAAITKAGYTPTQTTRYTKYLQAQPYWRGKKPPLSTVAEGIAAYIASHPDTPKQEFPLPEHHYDPALDDGTPATPEQLEQARTLFNQLVQRTNANGR